METKYYIPSIEEWHIGFEYEIKCVDVMNNGEPCWTRIKALVPADFTSFKRDIPVCGNRVKFLDKKDIEELGFKEYPGFGNKSNYFIFLPNEEKYNLIPHKYYSLNMFYWEPNYVAMYWNKCSIDIHYENTEPRRIFEGDINNKSELRKIMKMLNIK